MAIRICPLSSRSGKLLAIWLAPVAAGPTTPLPPRAKPAQVHPELPGVCDNAAPAQTRQVAADIAGVLGEYLRALLIGDAEVEADAAGGGAVDFRNRDFEPHLLLAGNAQLIDDVSAGHVEQVPRAVARAAR